MRTKLTVDERNAVDGFVRCCGAANLDIKCRGNKSSWTVGFRVFKPDSASYHIESCFRVSLDELPALPALIDEIERHLNACIVDPDVAHGKPVPPGSAL